ncbi:hypothetical protein BpHYR1_014791 [Brachionus plicatilis]|uniref:Uncharacterized protein n=1 Tax=Brachionus plicatilis TaxID=10195 RepID=A0A3M7SSV1_BRAPC|nr:hypothetical protein BpHYR1_014791 [Brachionus plicatilis]
MLILVDCSFRLPLKCSLYYYLCPCLLKELHLNFIEVNTALMMIYKALLAYLIINLYTTIKKFPKSKENKLPLIIFNSRRHLLMLESLCISHRYHQFNSVALLNEIKNKFLFYFILIQNQNLKLKLKYNIKRERDRTWNIGGFTKFKTLMISEFHIFDKFDKFILSLKEQQLFKGFAVFEPWLYNRKKIIEFSITLTLLVYLKFGTIFSTDGHHAFEITPIVDKRFKRGHFYDSKNNYHKISRRFIAEDLSKIELIHPEDDIIDYIHIRKKGKIFLPNKNVP